MAKFITLSNLSRFKDWLELTLSDAFEKLVKTIPTKLSDLEDDADHRLVTDVKKNVWDNKQDKTDSGLNTTSKQLVGAINENKQRIDNLFAIGRYLAIWNAKTGLPTSNPSGTPYPYKAGDWFLVGVIADEGGTNYMPDGTEYTGEASTTPYTEDVPLKVGDRFFFDGTTWKPLVATYPYDNNVKYDEQTLTDEQKLQARTNIGAQDALSLQQLQNIADVPNKEDILEWATDTEITNLVNSILD